MLPRGCYLGVLPEYSDCLSKELRGQVFTHIPLGWGFRQGVDLYGFWAVGLSNIDGWRNLRTHGGLIRWKKCVVTYAHF